MAAGSFLFRLLCVVPQFLSVSSSFDSSCSQVVREIDDHADIIGVEIVTDTTKYGGKAAQLVRSCHGSFS